MIARLRSLLFIALATTAWVPSLAQSSKPAPPPSSAQQKKDYSKEAIIIERLVTRAEYEADGSSVRETTAVFRVQAEAGVQGLGILRFPYTTENETVEVEYVRVRKPDGTVVQTPNYNIQDMPAEVTRIAPLYSDIHEKHVAVKALGVDDTLEYAVRYRTTKPQVPGQFWFEYSFTKALITKNEELEISVPRDKYVKVSSPDLPPQIKDENSRRVYVWKTANLEREQDQAQAARRQAPPPSVQITTFRSWDEVGHWFGELERSQTVVTPEIRAKAADITKGLTNDDDKVRALYNFVSTHFRYISLSFGIGRYQPHAAADVLDNEYGDCKDKHTLLATLLKAAGYTAWPALINSSRAISPDVPSPGQFDHVITVIVRGNSLLWVDTTPEVAPFGLLLANLRNKQALVVPAEKEASLMTTPENPPFATSVLFTAEGKLNSEGTLTAHIERTLRSDGEVLVRLGFRGTSPAQWKELVQGISYASGFAGEVDSVTSAPPDDINQPFHFAYDYTRKSYADWDNRRILPALPPFGIEAGNEGDKKPVEPLLLGAPGELVYRSKIELPSGYTGVAPANVDLKLEFIEYHATYAINHGVLTAERLLRINKSEVPLTAWDKYCKFRKTVSDDESRFILLTAESSTPAKSGVAFNQQAEDKFQEGTQALRRRDIIAAQEAFRRVIQLEPRYLKAHQNLGFTYLIQNNVEAGLGEFRKEEELNPDNPIPYKASATALLLLHRPAEAMDQWRKLLKVDPKDRDAALGLSQLLSADKKYGEAIEVLEAALQGAPDSPSLRASLGFAYLNNGQKDKRVAAVRQAVREDADANLLNNAAYSLAEADAGLEQAKSYAEKAVQKLETDSLKITAADEPLALATTNTLWAYWDTLGWVYFHLGDLDKAVAYLRPGWLLSQDGVIGDHLAQVYEKQGKSREAAHTYELALATWGNDKERDEIRQHYKRLTGKEPGQHPWVRGANGTFMTSPVDELSRMRTFQVSTGARPYASATFIIIFSTPGKVDDVTFVSGAEDLKALSSRLKEAKFNLEFPDTNPAKIACRGILACGSTGCNFVTVLPEGRRQPNIRVVPSPNP